MKHAREDYSRIQDPENLIGEDEPVFLIRAKDMNAPSVVEYWATMAKKRGADNNIVQAALDHALEMREWQEKNGKKIPDMP